MQRLHLTPCLPGSSWPLCPVPGSRALGPVTSPLVTFSARSGYLARCSWARSTILGLTPAFSRFRTALFCGTLSDPYGTSACREMSYCTMLSVALVLLHCVNASGALLGPRSVAWLCPVAVPAPVAPFALPCPWLPLRRPWMSLAKRSPSPSAPVRATSRASLVRPRCEAGGWRFRCGTVLLIVGHAPLSSRHE